ncbi:MAG: hypothetical protein QY332_18945 [Anaerolineales bacterium]|nr:MAG: hypothetical protein QY332_18945 [Anaerolineales bacterium]
MTIEYDEKGKFYTNVVSKVAVHSILQTTTHLIKGLVHVRQGERFKDELEHVEHYVAVTNASVYDADGKVIFSGPFLAVQSGQIVWIMPVDEDGDRGEGG